MNGFRRSAWARYSSAMASASGRATPTAASSWYLRSSRKRPFSRTWADGDARPDDAQRPRVEDARRDQVDGETPLLVDHGVARVGTAMAADNEVRITGEQVDDFALALVAPMPADDRSYRHRPTLPS